MSFTILYRGARRHNMFTGDKRKSQQGCVTGERRSIRGRQAVRAKDVEVPLHTGEVSGSIARGGVRPCLFTFTAQGDVKMSGESCFAPRRLREAATHAHANRCRQQRCARL